MFTAEQRKVFFDEIRGFVALTPENVPGFDKVLDYGAARGSDRESLAYIVATAYWESGHTMKPVKEAYWLSEAWRRQHLRYYPWYGRGLIQTTWEENYRKIAVLLGLPEDTFIKNPDLLLTYEYALPALFVGMEAGIYTGKDLDDYIDGIDEDDDEDLREYANARRIVNGADKQIEIAVIALSIERGLKAAGYPDNPLPVPEEPVVEPEPSPLPELPGGTPAPDAPQSWWEKLLGAVVDIILLAFGKH